MEASSIPDYLRVPASLIPHRQVFSDRSGVIPELEMGGSENALKGICIIILGNKSV